MEAGSKITTTKVIKRIDLQLIFKLKIFIAVVVSCLLAAPLTRAH